MRSTADAIQGLKQKLIQWDVATEDELKATDKAVREAVDKEVAEAEEMPEPEATPQVLFEDVYVRGSEPDFLRGRVPDENFYYTEADIPKQETPVLSRSA
jgi:pyruvate dehydrogenase E1 component alpha subunit